ncbi:MAG TPA: L,D-transpeptidase family protein [Woeseiaceae bacterium]|jgi:L,D-transpeptidase ErfK/SrfK|nr:L,D-transpeptidase family protein [Woeseiaceae bacterium]
MTGPQLFRRFALLPPFLLMGGCSTLDDFLAGLRKPSAEAAVPLRERPLQAPISANHFVLDSVEQTVIGEPQVVFTRSSDTLSDLARAYGLGYDELIAANPGVDPWLPGEATPVLLPTQFVLPDVPREGLVLNIASKRLFYFPAMPDGEKRVVKTYPIGIGRVGWETPLGMTTVVAKAKDPHWFVPASVRREHAEMGDPLPSVVPPGPDNPLGHRVLQLEMPGYLIHGTNQPYGVGMRVSHGCVRLYPENIELLYELVEIGEPVLIINEPYLLGRRDGDLYFEPHQPLEDDSISPEDRLSMLFDAPLAGSLGERERNHVRSLASIANGLPLRVAAFDSDEILSRAQPVHNIVEEDPDAPTLSEVREMIDEAVREAESEAGAETL